MFFLLNDVVLRLELQMLAPPMQARKVSSLSLDCVKRLAAEMYAEEPRLQHRSPERAKRLATLIVSKAPQVNAALFVAPARGCDPGEVSMRLAQLDLPVLAKLHQEQQSGHLTPAIADREVWAREPA
jgi:hypothetical protein